jgi:thiamine-phosphate diphosphorylase/hydroxyethylthiazole kinase
MGGFKDPVSFVRQLARKERCIILLTGETDYISDGTLAATIFPFSLNTRAR